MKIIKNAIQCKLCKDVIESTHRHDFKWCKCESVAVDGGKDYFKRTGEPSNMIDMSKTEEEKTDPVLEVKQSDKEYVLPVKGFQFDGKPNKNGSVYNSKMFKEHLSGPHDSSVLQPVSHFDSLSSTGQSFAEHLEEKVEEYIEENNKYHKILRDHLIEQMKEQSNIVNSLVAKVKELETRISNIDKPNVQ